MSETKPLLFQNIRAHSLSQQNDIANDSFDSIIITGGKITYVGDAEDAKRIAPNAKVIDLDGCADVYPGFVDAHAHVYGTGERMVKPRLEGLSSIAEIIAKLTPLKRASGWIIARGWDQHLWPGKKLPTASDLESLGNDQPIALTRIDGHALWCNKRALELAGVTIQTHDPIGGSILRDENGEPTGMLIDEAMKLIERSIPTEGEAETGRILRAGLNRFALGGHVAVHDMGVDARVWDAFQNLYSQSGDELPRTWLFLDMNKQSGKERFLEIAKGKIYESVHPRLQFAGIKIYLDGALGSRGANLFEPYSDDPINRGLKLSDDDEVLELMKLAAKQKLQIAVHAIGDAANSRALDLFQHITEPGATLRIEHAQMVRIEDLSRYATLGVHAVVQPAFFKSDRHWAIERLGARRMKLAYRWKSLIDAGINLVASSDSPVEIPDTLSGIELLQSREGVRDGEALNRIEAECAYMQNVYRITGESQVLGEIKARNKAELTFVGKAENSNTPTILGTMVDGTWIYCADEFSERIH